MLDPATQVKRLSMQLSELQSAGATSGAVVPVLLEAQGRCVCLVVGHAEVTPPSAVSCHTCQHCRA